MKHMRQLIGVIFFTMFIVVMLIGYRVNTVLSEVKQTNQALAVYMATHP